MTQPAHVWMLELVQVAEELGYTVREIGHDTIKITRPSPRSGWIDVYIGAVRLDGELLRPVLVPVEKPDVR